MNAYMFTLYFVTLYFVLFNPIRNLCKYTEIVFCLKQQEARKIKHSKNAIKAKKSKQTYEMSFSFILLNRLIGCPYNQASNRIDSQWSI